MINPLRRVELTQYTLHHPMIPTSLNGVRIAHISDVHMGRWVKPHHMRQLTRLVNAAGPDLVALTGDYVGYDRRDLQRCVDAFSALAPPTFAVLGNHDHWAGSALAMQAFEDSHITLLTNAHLTCSPRHGAPPIAIVGVDDQVTGHADVPRAFAELDPALFCLTLNHVPSLAPACAQHGAHLILSGHTHNFQFNIPRFTHRIATLFGTEYFAGPYRIDQAVLYISRGLGSASWPWRIRATPELTYVTLKQGRSPILELTSLTHFGLD